LATVDLYEIKGHLEGHIFAYGRIGGGKSVSMLSIIQGFHDNYGYKILDIFGGERNEGLYWTLPSDEASYWLKLGQLGKFDEEGAKQYKVNLLYPYFKTKLPKKLPKKKDCVQSKIFTIPIKSLDTEDVAMVIGNPSETSKYELNEILNIVNKKTNSGNILELLEKNKKLKQTLFYKNFLLPLVRDNLLMDSYCDYNLDLISEMRDRETITVLCLDYVPEQFHIFILNYILRQVMDLIDGAKIGRKNLIFMRESATFFRATEDSVLEDKYKIFRTKMAHYIRMGRRGAYFGLDCQSASETRGLVQGSEDYLLMFRTTSWRDKSELTDELKRERRIRTDQIGNMAFLEKGQALICETGRNVRKVQITLPRTMFWKKEYGNFYKNVWERFGGSWMMTEEVSDYITDRCKQVKRLQSSIPLVAESPEIVDKIEFQAQPQSQSDVPVEITDKPVISEAKARRIEEEKERKRKVDEALNKFFKKMKK
jgi:hypothetical protein